MPKVTPIIPVVFPVFVDEEPASATLDFANHDDVIATTRWRVPRTLIEAPAMQSRAADARELAMLAAKRWRHYRTTHTIAHSLDQLRELIATGADGEYCFHLKVTADWFPASLGGAMVRRTWCHHLMLDFIVCASQHLRPQSQCPRCRSQAFSSCLPHRSNHQKPLGLGRSHS